MEQGDTLISSLTVQDTVDYAARLARMKGQARVTRVNELIEAFGLREQRGVQLILDLEGNLRWPETSSQYCQSANYWANGPFLDETTS